MAVVRKQMTKYAVTENSISYILVTHNQDNMTDTLRSVIQIFQIKRASYPFSSNLRNLSEFSILQLLVTICLRFRRQWNAIYKNMASHKAPTTTGISLYVYANIHVTDRPAWAGMTVRRRWRVTWADTKGWWERWSTRMYRRQRDKGSFILCDHQLSLLYEFIFTEASLLFKHQHLTGEK